MGHIHSGNWLSFITHIFPSVQVVSLHCPRGGAEVPSPLPTMPVPAPFSIPFPLVMLVVGSAILDPLVVATVGTTVVI